MNVVFSTLAFLREKRPLVHAITNFVTANFCADILLAAGASPMMTSDAGEAKEATSIANALYLNIGTLDPTSVEAMFLAGQAAKENGLPIVFDPVGASATDTRRRTSRKILRQICPDVVKGNLSEMLYLADVEGIVCHGVDAGNFTPEPELIAGALKKFAQKNHLFVIATGKDDFITDGNRVAVIHNGCAMLEYITGTGCALGALCAAASAQPGELFNSQLNAVLTMGIAGEIAQNAIGTRKDFGSFKVRLLDAIGNLTDQDLQDRGKYEFLA